MKQTLLYMTLSLALNFSPLAALAQNVGLFASLDFERSVTLASQIERPELRLMAQSKIAQAILIGKGSAPIFRLPAYHPHRDFIED